MCAKLVSFICVLALASTSYGVVIGGWEGNMDGWTVEWGETTSFSSTGATMGSSSALKVMPSWTEWYVGAMDRPLSGSEMALVTSRTADKFQLDVTRFAADWTPGAWGWWTPESRIFLSVSFGLQNDDDEWYYYGAGQEVLGAAWYPTSIAPDHLTWRNGLQYADPDVTMTAEWSLATVQSAYDTAISNGFYRNGGMDIRLVCNIPDYVAPGAAYYLDNARLTPEPATMALLGLGGLAMIRRKR
jgi:hypothetical protein